MPINIATSIGEVDMQNYVNTQVSNQLGTQLPPAVSTEVTNQLNSNTKIEKMTQANITYYVSGSGSNSNDGLTAGTPFLTIGYAISLLPQVINHTVTINVADGTYNESITLKNIIGSGVLIIQGNTTTPANCIVNYIYCTGVNLNYTIKGFTTVLTTVDSVTCYNCIGFTIGYINSVATSTHAGFSCFSSIGRIVSSTFSNKSYGILSEYTSILSSENNAGTNNTVGLYSVYGSKITKTGTQPAGTTQESISSGGRIIASINSSVITTNGYRYNDDGTIEQWGKVTINEIGNGSSGNTTVTLPIAFPNGILHQSGVASFNLTSNDPSWLETVNVNVGRMVTNPLSTIRIQTMPLSSSFPGGSNIEITWYVKGY